MSQPLLAIMVVTKGHSFLLVRDKENKWTFPSSCADQDMEPEDGIKKLAGSVLYPFFKDLVVRSVHLLMPVIEGMAFGDDRIRTIVFKCEVEGSSREAEDAGVAWFAPIKDLPPHAVSPDIRGILEALSAQSRFL